MMLLLLYWLCIAQSYRHLPSPILIHRKVQDSVYLSVCVRYRAHLQHQPASHAISLLSEHQEKEHREKVTCDSFFPSLLFGCNAKFFGSFFPRQHCSCSLHNFCWCCFCFHLFMCVCFFSGDFVAWTAAFATEKNVSNLLYLNQTSNATKWMPRSRRKSRLRNGFPNAIKQKACICCMFCLSCSGGWTVFSFFFSGPVRWCHFFLYFAYYYYHFRMLGVSRCNLVNFLLCTFDGPQIKQRQLKHEYFKVLKPMI